MTVGAKRVPTTSSRWNTFLQHGSTRTTRKLQFQEKGVSGNPSLPCRNSTNVHSFKKKRPTKIKERKVNKKRIKLEAAIKKVKKNCCTTTLNTHSSSAQTQAPRGDCTSAPHTKEKRIHIRDLRHKRKSKITYRNRGLGNSEALGKYLGGA